VDSQKYSKNPARKPTPGKASQSKVTIPAYLKRMAIERSRSRSEAGSSSSSHKLPQKQPPGGQAVRRSRERLDGLRAKPEYKPPLSRVDSKKKLRSPSPYRKMNSSQLSNNSRQSANDTSVERRKKKFLKKIKVAEHEPVIQTNTVQRRGSKNAVVEEEDGDMKQIDKEIDEIDEKFRRLRNAMNGVRGEKGSTLNQSNSVLDKSL
jgi:hypothetical protein